MLFSKLADVWTQLEETGSRLEMADIFAKLLLEAKKEEIKPLIYLSEGIIVPSHEELELGLGERLTLSAISTVSGYSISELDRQFKKQGDMGLVAKWAAAKKKQTSLASSQLDLIEVYNSLLRLAKMQGKGSQDGKIKAVAELLNSANGDEAKYIVRFCMGKMRLGIAQPTMIDALAKIKMPGIKKEICGISEEGTKHIFKIRPMEYEEEEESPSLNLSAVCIDSEFESLQDKQVCLLHGEDKKICGMKVCKIKKDANNSDLYHIELMGFKKAVRSPIVRAYNLCSDLGKICTLALFDYEKIENFEVELFSPIRPALAERLSSTEEIIEKIGPCAVEGKYDGFRLQVHKDGENVELYSRKLEKVSHAFPEILQAAKKLKVKKCIFEGEALAYNAKEKKYYSFQVTIQRKRKYGIEQMQKDFPLHMFAFDVMYIDGVDYTQMPYAKRREALEGLVHESKIIVPSALKHVQKAGELENFFQKCISEGLEGIIAKDLNSPYVAGAREFAWIKLKRSYGALADTFDTVIVGYYLGEGQRTEFNFGGLLVAVRNEENGQLETVAKIGSGFSEEEMEELGKTLAKMKIKQKPAQLEANLKPDFWVEPKIVVSVSADEISISSVHTCAQAGGKGYALRFPRLVDIRSDKGIDEITTSSEVEKMFGMQKGAQKK
ncbi:MAG: ATP-dependent DNA ligase [Candidatus Micrarchaeia archaeon]